MIPLCKYQLRGHCRFGNECYYSHNYIKKLRPTANSFHPQNIKTDEQNPPITEIKHEKLEGEINS